jgi:hypothetical protein
METEIKNFFFNSKFFEDILEDIVVSDDQRVKIKPE